MHALDIIEFWFASERQSLHFKKDPAFDEEIKTLFLQTYQKTLSESFQGEMSMHTKTAKGSLALVLLYDQFPRNMFRDTPQAFATDEQALKIANQAIVQGFDKQLEQNECVFLYMPFMHSENIHDQERGIHLFELLRVKSSAAFAVAHYNIIAQFGRFPHRNEILGRKSTPEEKTFLAQPGSSF